MTRTPAPAGQVRAALERVLVWEPDLHPDDRYVALVDLDLASVVAGVVRRLPGAPDRMGWSAAVMGVASRLWSLTVAPYVADGVLLDPATFVARHDDGAVTLGVRDPAGWTGASVGDLDRVVRSVLEPLIASVVAQAPLSPRLLWGNAAASLHAVPRVHHLPRARAVVDELLTGPGLAGELTVSADGRARRRTCCLFYLVPGSGLCGDCVFDVPPGRGR